MSEGKNPAPLISPTGIELNILPLVKASSAELNNQPFSSPSFAILSKASFCCVLAIMLPVVCIKLFLRFFSSPINCLITAGNSCPVNISKGSTRPLTPDVSSLPVIFLRALIGSSISYLATCIKSATLSSAKLLIASSRFLALGKASLASACSDVSCLIKLAI